MGLFQSKSVQPSQAVHASKPLQPIIFAPKIVLKYPKAESNIELKIKKEKTESNEERDDRLKHAAIIFESKKVKHHIEEELR